MTRGVVGLPDQNKNRATATLHTPFWTPTEPRVEDWILVGKFLVSGPRGNQDAFSWTTLAGVDPLIRGDPLEPFLLADPGGCLLFFCFGRWKK